MLVQVINTDISSDIKVDITTLLQRRITHVEAYAIGLEQYEYDICQQYIYDLRKVLSQYQHESRKGDIHVIEELRNLKSIAARLTLCKKHVVLNLKLRGLVAILNDYNVICRIIGYCIFIIPFLVLVCTILFMQQRWYHVHSAMLAV